MYFVRLGFPICMCVIFYVNYLWLAPYYFISRHIRPFICFNAVIIIALSGCMQELMDIMHGIDAPVNHVSRPPHDQFPRFSEFIIFMLRNVFLLVLSAALATLVRLSRRWNRIESERKELEIQKTEAEMKNLRNQVNPHFLLNTLNNIYALIAMDQDKAQRALLSLSEMLRQMLYGTHCNAVALEDEVRFIKNYIELMRLRLDESVKLEVDMSVPKMSELRIAPFILISLVENAFKHGVCLTQPSFISVRVVANTERIECEIRNSNYPKGGLDKSGHGIGLGQVGRLLDLSYGDKYEWTKGVENNNDIYFSKIIIYDTKLCDNR